MTIEERYEWDFSKSESGNNFHRGVSDTITPVYTSKRGIQIDESHIWQKYERVTNEIDKGQLISRSIVESKDSDYGEWENESITEYLYNEQERPIQIVDSRWNEDAGTYEVVRKKYFYYPFTPVVLGSEAKEISYSLFPNPASDKIYINGPTGFSVAHIFNLQGEIIMSSCEREIDLINIPPGLYLLRILVQGSMSSSHLFVKI